VIESPTRPTEPDELEALIREARARQRKRWLAASAVVAIVAGAVVAVYSIVGGGRVNASHPGVPIPAAATGKGCGVRGLGVRILSTGGRTLYREPGRYTHPNRGFPTIRCSGSTIWAVWFNGAGTMKEAYVGARSLDAGHTWKLVFSEPFFGVKAPHALDAYMGPWTLRGRIAYFTGWCPACGTGTGTTSLWVTTDGGRTFREYQAPALIGYEPIGLRISGRRVTISAKGFVHSVWRRKIVSLRVG
jgi:hypothetical protein